MLLQIFFVDGNPDSHVCNFNLSCQSKQIPCEFWFTRDFLEVTSGFEPLYEVLQTSA